MRLVLLLALLFSGGIFGDEFVRHPVPKKPVYLKESWHSTLKGQVGKPPALDSAVQKADEAELFKYQSRRSPNDCDRAKGEIFVSVGNFYGVPNGPLNQSEVATLTPFFEQLRNDADYFIQKLKVDYPRKRPFAYIQGLAPCVGKEVTGAYPSGHAVLSRLFANVLTDFFPHHKDILVIRSEEISDHRVLSGMHHRSDIEAGKKVGDLVYEQLQKSPKYQHDFEELKAKLTPKS